MSEQSSQPVRRSRSPIRAVNSERTQSEPPPQSPSADIDYTNLRYTFVAGKRLNSKMLHATDEQQMYRFRVKHKNVAQYNCYIDNCNAKLHVDLLTLVCARKVNCDTHNHGRNDLIDGIQLRDSIKKRCRSAAVAARSCSDGNVRNIFHSTIRDEGTTVHRTPSWTSVRRNLYRIRSEALPPSPKSAADVKAAYMNLEIMATYGMTANSAGVESSAFFRKVHFETQFAYCIFASEFIMKYVAELPEDRRHFFMDGTFRVVPYGDFTQLLVIHAAFFGNTIPFIYVLMTRKTTEAYMHLFRYMQNAIIDFQPTSFMTDYEVAMRNALRVVYPQAKMFSCWFHFCQAVKRHGSQIGGFLMVARANTDTAKLYHELLCLPLLPPEHIITVFKVIKMEAKTNHGNLFDKFLNYYERQWIIKEGPQNISVFGIQARTTASLEAYNCALNSRIKTKGSFYAFALAIIDEEFVKRTELQTLIESGGGSIRKQKRSQREKLIAEASEDLKKNKISPHQFILRIAYNSKPFVMTDMDSVGVNTDELLLDLLRDVNEDDVDAPVALENNNIVTCVICKLSTDLSVIFSKCKHLILCAECYDQYLATTRAAYEEAVEHMVDVPPFLVKCPACRVMQEPDQIISGIFTP